MVETLAATAPLQSSTTSTAPHSPRAATVNSRSRQQPNSSSPSAGKAWRPLSKTEVASKRRHQSAVCQSVCLLTACLNGVFKSAAAAAADVGVAVQTSRQQMQLSVDAHGEDSREAPELILPVLEVLSNPQELKLHVMTACQLIDRGVGSRIAIAANQGITLAFFTLQWCLWLHTAQGKVCQIVQKHATCSACGVGMHPGFCVLHEVCLL